MKRRLLATFLSLCLLVGLLPTVALATDEEPGTEPASVCTCEALCTEGVADETCSVCAEDYTLCTYVAPDEPACAQLEGCVNGAHAADCPLYVEPTDDTLQEQEQEEPAAQPVTSTESTPNLLNGNGASGPLSGTCGAEGNETGVTWTLTQNNSGSEPATYTLTISGTGAMEDFDDPTSTEDGAVTAPWYAALSPDVDDLVPITEIVIGDGITYVGSYAFAYTSVTMAAFNENIADYGSGIYYGCTDLTTVDWTNFKPTKVNDDFVNYRTETGPFVPFSLFDQCENLKTCKIESTTYDVGTLVLPENITGICTAAFRNTGFSDVDFFDGLSHIKFVGPYGLAALSQMKSVTIPKNVTFYPADEGSGGARTFTGGALETVTIQSQGTTIAVEMFYQCTNLKTVVNADKIAEIGKSAFVNSKLESFSSENVKKIGQYAFLNNTSLTSLKLGAVEEIGGGAFGGCSALKTVDIKGSAGLNIPNTAFGTSGNSTDNAAPIESFTLENGTPPLAFTATAKSTLKTLVLGDGVNWEIPVSYCQNATQLESVILGNGITGIGNYAFYKCSNLATVNLPADGQLTTIGTAAFSSDYNYSSATDKGKSDSPKIQTIDIPASVTSIGYRAFSACMSLNTVRVAPRSSLTNIGAGAFLDCFGLETVDLSGISSSATIGSYSFGFSSGKRNQNCIFYVTDDSVLAKLDSNHAVSISEYSNNLIAVTNGGTFAKETQFGNTALSTPAKEGGIFVGWYENNSFTGSAVTSPQAGQTYYAKWIELTSADISMQYGGTQAVPTISGVSLDNWISADPSIVQIDDGQLKAVGVGKTTVTADASLARSGEKLTVNVEVTPRQLTYSASDQDNPGSITYSFSEDHTDLSSLMTFKWKDGDTTVTLNEGEDIDYTYTVPTGSGGTGQEATVDFLPMPVGTYQVKFNLKNPNYIFANTQEGGTPLTSLTITVNVTNAGQTRAYLAAITPVGTSFTYDGTGKLPVSGTLTAYAEDSTSSNVVEIDTFTVMVEGLNDTTFHGETPDIPSGTNLADCDNLELPEEPGTYVLTISASTDSHYIYKSQVFTIDKATVTIKPNDKSAYVGDALPTLGENDYTVTGLVGSDTLTTTPELSYEGTPDMNTTGTYTIKASGAAVDEDHYTLTYVDGTLTVSRRSSGGGGGSSSGGSSSSNVSGSGDDVSISASGGSVTASQMESAVNKADAGSAITIKATGSNKISLPASGLESAADNDNSLTLDLRYGEVTLSPEALSAVADQAGSTVTLTVAPVDTDELNSRQQAAVGDAPVFDLTIRSGSTVISDFDGGLVTVSIPYELPSNQDPAGVVVWFMDDDGNITPCETMYDTRTETVIFTTRHFSKYVIGYEEPTVFTDVSEDAYYADAVLWAVANGVTNGTSATTFSPDMAVSRAQMVTFLWRAHGSPKATGANPFTDVSTSDYYYDAVLWAVANGVTNGTSATTFSPDAPVTRAQAVTFQWRAAGSPVVSGSSFGDVAADAYYVNAVTWAVANGITNGTSGTTFSPDVVVSRAQAVTFLWRELA